ncbi:MAG: SDR family oxidoreductase [Actinomycetota bacterium]|nr:SDR family oxidoreductase [Actinomycetota bacterium]
MNENGTASNGPILSAVVTGGSSGIGAAIVARFVQAGVAVVQIDLQEPPAAITSSAHFVQGSSGDARTLKRAITTAQGLADRFGIFCACAGISNPGNSLHYPDSEWQRIVDVNLSSVFFGARQAATAMEAGGSIVAIGSVHGHLGFGGRAAYSASKAGVIGLVRSLAIEWAPRGIRVNSVSPGYTATDLVNRNIASGAIDTEQLRSRIPANRLGTPQEVAEAVWFLASDASSYVTGADLLVDGGLAAYGLPLNG